MNTRVEDNKIINEFMGLHDRIRPLEDEFYWSDPPYFYVSESSFEVLKDSIARYSKWDKSWGEIMSVVDKIESIKLEDGNTFNVTIGPANYCFIRDSYGHYKSGVDSYGSSKLETLYKSVVEFINDYNNLMYEFKKLGGDKTI